MISFLRDTILENCSNGSEKLRCERPLKYLVNQYLPFDGTHLDSKLASVRNSSYCSKKENADLLVRKVRTTKLKRTMRTTCCACP